MFNFIVNYIYFRKSSVNLYFFLFNPVQFFGSLALKEGMSKLSDKFEKIKDKKNYLTSYI